MSSCWMSRRSSRPLEKPKNGATTAQHNDTQYDDTQYDDTQYDDTQYDDTQYDDTQYDDTHHNNIKIRTLSMSDGITLLVILLLCWMSLY